MSGFTEAALEKKLTELNNSQQSIQTLSLWLIHHRKHHKIIVHVWFKELKKAKPVKKLTFIYLANDVIQNSKKKGPEFTKEFGTVLKKALACVALKSDEKTVNALKRVLNVWAERNVFDANLIDDFREVFTSDIKRSKTNEKKENKIEVEVPAKIKIKHKRRSQEEVPVSVDSEVKPEIKKPKVEPVSQEERAEELAKSPARDPPDPEELIRALQELENSASTDATVREKIASLPPEVSDSTLLEKVQDQEAAEKLSKQVDEACNLLADYNSRLAEELEDRKLVARMLADFVKSQREQLSLSEQKLEEYKDKQRKVTQVRNELKSHLQNLPDLTLLPNVTGGLAPLPSAGDLFSQR